MRPQFQKNQIKFQPDKQSTHWPDFSQDHDEQYSRLYHGSQLNEEVLGSLGSVSSD